MKALAKQLDTALQRPTGQRAAATALGQASTAKPAACNTVNEVGNQVMTHILAKLLVLIASLGPLPSALAQSSPQTQSVCAPIAIPGHYGPFDYISQKAALAIVEEAHFTIRVESLLGGASGYLGHDLSYTLNASPNHHRALFSAMRFAIREKTDQPPYMRISVSCYFDRAVRFRPRDTVVRGLYAKYLFDFLKEKDAALRQVNAVVEIAGDNPFTHYNAGLLYFEMGEYAKAAERAAHARELGFPREDLIDKLKQVGRWPAESASAPSKKAVP